MSTNFSPTPGSAGNYGSGSGGNQKTTLLYVAIVVLLCLSVFLLVSRYKTGQELSAAQTELTDQKTALAELDTKYNEAVAELELQKGQNQELNNQINAQLAELEKQKNQIASMIREKKDYRAGLARFEKQKKEYLTQIEDLKKQVGLLTETNAQQGEQIQQLNTNLNETQTRLQEESNAKSALTKEKTNLEKERVQLSKKVDIASAIRVKNVTTKSVQVSKSGKEKSKSSAKKVDKLNICFTTEPNEVVPAGEETFYLRIVDPTGAPLAVESLGSGVAQDKRNDTDVRFTTTASCNYQNGETQVCGSWQPGQNFVKGKYKIEIYNKGYLVGTGGFNLK
jgi:hypothetical protein